MAIHVFLLSKQAKTMIIFPDKWQPKQESKHNNKMLLHKSWENVWHKTEQNRLSKH